MKKIFVLVSVLFAAAFLSCGGKGLTAIKIGFMGPMTGDQANYGKLMSQSVQLAIDEKNANGGIGGRMIEFVATDDEAKVDKANAAIEKLASVDNVLGFVGAVFSSCSLAVAPKSEQAKIIMISPSSTHKELPDKGSYIFRTIAGDDLQARIFAKYMATIGKTRKIAILYIKNDYSQALANDFKNYFEKEGGVITAMESGLQGDKDFKTQLTKIRSTNPEALYIPNYYPEIAQIIDQSKQLGMQIKFISADGFSNPQIFKLAGKDANGIIFSNSAADDSNNGRKKIFISKYKTRWGVEPDQFSLNSYDAAMILINAIETHYNSLNEYDKKSLNLNRNSICQIVAATKDYNGVSGNITFTPNGDLVKNIGVFISENNAYKQLSVFNINAQGKISEIK